MGKLHELLAVESELKSNAERAMSNARGLFTQAQERFLGRRRDYFPLEESGDPMPSEVQKLETTVGDELKVLWDAFGAWLDVVTQKELTNTEAFADLEVDGKLLLPKLTATALLSLESRLSEMRKIMATIPTNAAGTEWTWDDDANCFRSAKEETYRTVKRPRVLVKYDATPEHPAQVDTWAEDVRVGRYIGYVESGMWPAAKKREVMNRFDKLLIAVKAARQRANDIEATKRIVAHELRDYIFGE